MLTYDITFETNSEIDKLTRGSCREVLIIEDTEDFPDTMEVMKS